MQMKWQAICVAATAFLAGCQQPGANLQANVYQAGQVNQQQDARVVTILAIIPAKIEVGNQQAKSTAQVIGVLAGGVGGALLGNSFGGYRGTNALIGGGLGAAAGGFAGSLVPDKTLVEGVSLTYVDNGKTLNSAQVGRMCEFKRGDTILISAGPGETRLQANENCPEPGKSRI